MRVRILDCMAAGMAEGEILAQYPTLMVVGIRAAAAYGAALARDEPHPAPGMRLKLDENLPSDLADTLSARVHLIDTGPQVRAHRGAACQSRSLHRRPCRFDRIRPEGRLHGSILEQMETDIIAAWQEARSRGDTVALMASNIETIIRLNQLAQKTRVKSKKLDPAGPSLRVGENMMLVGDEVVTRRNDRTLRTDQGLMVKNRDHWTITCIHRERSVILTGRTGVVQLPIEYVTEHLELGYAQTSHATQGRTVDV